MDKIFYDKDSLIRMIKENKKVNFLKIMIDLNLLSKEDVLNLLSSNNSNIIDLINKNFNLKEKGYREDIEEIAEVIDSKTLKELLM